MPGSPRPAGLILAGGRSSRFGAEKAVQMLRGRTLLEWALAALSEGAAPIAVSASPQSGAAALALRLGLRVLGDDPAHPGGPLAGIAAGLGWARDHGATRLVTLPCDCPGVTAAIISRLLEQPAAYALTNDGPQALCAVWPVTALSGLAETLDAGRHPAVREALRLAGAAPVRFDDAAPFRNLNTPDDLATF